MFRIAGIVVSGRPEDAEGRLGAMLESMRRHPSDAVRTRAFPELRCCVGWIASETTGTDFDGLVLQQPDRLLLFAGEHFNDSGPITTRPFHQHSSIWAVLDAPHGGFDSRLRDLNGWFAGVLVNLRSRTLVVFNDRFGLRRLYYTSTGEGFAFASEAKALLPAQPAGPRWDSAAVAATIACGSPVNGATVFRDVSVLPPASLWTVESGGRLDKGRYFSPEEWEHQTLLPADEYYDRLKHTLMRVVPRYLAGHTGVGLSLTGGVDSRVIAAFAGRTGQKPLAYTFGGMRRDCYDVKIAAAVAEACGYDHQVLRLDRRFLESFAQHAEDTVWSTDGALDVGAAHEVLLNRLARTFAPVRVTGNYGSEIFRAVSTFRPIGMSEGLLETDFLPLVRDAAGAVERLRAAHPVTFAAFTELPWHLFGRLNAGQHQLVQRSPYTDNELVALAYRARAEIRAAMPLWNRLIAERDLRLAGIPTDRGHVATLSSTRTLPNRLYNYLLFKAEWYYEGGTPHWLANIDRIVYNNGRKPFFAGTHKIENYRAWIRHPLDAYLDGLFSDPSLAGAPGVRWERARGLLIEHRSGRKNYAREILRLATFCLIQKLLMNRPSLPAIEPARRIEIGPPLKTGSLK